MKYLLTVSVCFFLSSLSEELPRRRGRTPPIIWVTGVWSAGSVESKRMRGNMQASLLQSGWGQQIASERFGPFAPPDAEIRYLDNRQMARSVKAISERLSKAGVVTDAFQAFTNLRPGAYRADLWRYMVLWDEGGVYLDMNIRLLQPLSSWINFDSDDLVLIKDLGYQSYWNAMMAASPRDVRVELLIKEVVRRIKDHEYGKSTLDITGPQVLYQITSSRHPVVQYQFTGEEVVSMKGPTRIARKDQALHLNVNHPRTYYASLWDNHEVYCDEPGPPGLCSNNAEFPSIPLRSAWTSFHFT
mmetsp:Transcript_15467/g.42291  ORF Transcript_15467/g.42291 Transcript_15467/m.42291 type:complete len:301 (-) Transcript_15467:323-1225(-)